MYANLDVSVNVEECLLTSSMPQQRFLWFDLNISENGLAPSMF